MPCLYCSELNTVALVYNISRRGCISGAKRGPNQKKCKIDKITCKLCTMPKTVSVDILLFLLLLCAGDKETLLIYSPHIFFGTQGCLKRKTCDSLLQNGTKIQFTKLSRKAKES